MSSNMKKWLSRITPLAIAFVMCLGVMWVFGSSAYAAETPDLVVTYGGQSTEFFFDADQGKLYKLNGEEKIYIENESVGLYTAIKNTGVADNVSNASGPKVLDLLAAAGITDTSKKMIKFIGSDAYSTTLTCDELFVDRFAFPNAARPASDPGDQGAAVTEDEMKDAVKVPVILNLKAPEDPPQISFGQVSPSERNKSSWAKLMLGQTGEGSAYPCAAIELTDYTELEAMPNATDENVTKPSGSEVSMGDVIGFGGEAKSSPYNGTIYYTTDGSDPDQCSAIYNWDTYKKDGFNYNPFTVDKSGEIVIKTVEYKYGYAPSKIKTFTYTVKTPDLLVVYGGTAKGFYKDAELGQLYTVIDGTQSYIENESVGLYTAIKNTGVADNVANASGPKVLDLLAAAGITDTSKKMVKFIGSDGYSTTLTSDELFMDRYAFPNAARPATDPGDQGAAVTEDEMKDAVKVPAVLNLNAPEDPPQVSFGQVSPSERNKPSWAKLMLGHTGEGSTYPCAAIELTDYTELEAMPNATDENVTVPSGSKVAVGDVIGFGGEEKSSPYNGTIYYTTDGSDPDQFSEIYNWDTYKKDGFNYNPITVAKKGDLVVKTVEYKYGFAPSKVKTFKYTTRTDLKTEGGKMTLSKTKVTVGAKPSVKVVLGGKTLKASTDYTVSIGSTKKVGTVSAKVTGKGDYKGTLTKSFKVIPAKAKFSKVTPGKKMATIVIKSQKASGVTKYQIAYKKAGTKTWKTTTTKTTKKVIKKLKKGAKYNFKVRAYGKTGYGAYSAVKTIKIK